MGQIFLHVLTRKSRAALIGSDRNRSSQSIQSRPRFRYRYRPRLDRTIRLPHSTTPARPANPFRKPVEIPPAARHNVPQRRTGRGGNRGDGSSEPGFPRGTGSGGPGRSAGRPQGRPALPRHPGGKPPGLGGLAGRPRAGPAAAHGRSGRHASLPGRGVAAAGPHPGGHGVRPPGGIPPGAGRRRHRPGDELRHDHLRFLSRGRRRGRGDPAGDPPGEWRRRSISGRSWGSTRPATWNG